jgi:predicted HTH domain antitoxin
VEALSSLRTFQQVVEERGIPLDRLYGREVKAEPTAEASVTAEAAVAAE